MHINLIGNKVINFEGEKKAKVKTTKKKQPRKKQWTTNPISLKESEFRLWEKRGYETMDYKDK
jgi:hypothetical protein